MLILSREFKNNKEKNFLFRSKAGVIGPRRGQGTPFLGKLVNSALGVGANCGLLPYLVSVYILNFPK